MKILYFIYADGLLYAVARRKDAARKFANMAKKEGQKMFANLRADKSKKKFLKYILRINRSIQQMTVYKRSQLTADTLKQWEQEAAGEWIIETARTIFDLSMLLSEKHGKIEMTKDGRVVCDGWTISYWRKQGDFFVAYLPGEGKPSKIIRGPWK